MHEYSLMENIIQSARAELQARGLGSAPRMKTLRITVGALDIHSRESFVQAFTVQIQNSPLAGAELDLTVVPARIHCEKCGYEGPIGEEDADCHDPMPVVECPRCSAVTPVIGGRGIREIELTIEEP